MTTEMILELVGYLSSFLVLVSLLMTSVVKFRVINGIGSAIFTVYAVLIHSYPTAVMNFCLVMINVYFLVRVLRNRIVLTLTETPQADSATTHFINHYNADIQKFFPDYELDPSETCYMVYADSAPVGILTGSRTGADSFLVTLDYAAPSHRDCSVGKFLYTQLKKQGIRILRAETESPAHKQYLLKMGFTQEGNQYQRIL